jgi:hypothetical protein
LKLWDDTFENDGFYPFDSLAVGYAVNHGYMECKLINARITDRRLFFFWVKPHEIEVSKKFPDQKQVTFSFKPKKQFHHFLIQRLVSPPI